MILKDYLSVTSICRGKFAENFIFMLDSAADIFGYGTVYSTRIKVLADFNTKGFICGIEFVDRKQFPEYEESDFCEHDGFMVTTELRTFLDLMIIEDTNLLYEYVDDLFSEYTMDEVTSYLNKKGFLQLFYDTLDIINFDLCCLEK